MDRVGRGNTRFWNNMDRGELLVRVKKEFPASLGSWFRHDSNRIAHSSTTTRYLNLEDKTVGTPIDHDECNRDFSPIFVVESRFDPDLIKLWLFMGEVVTLFLAPTQDPRLIQQSPFLRFFLVDLFPLWDTVRCGSICHAATHYSVLQYPRGMRKQTLILSTFCAQVKAHLRLMICGFPREPSRCSMHGGF